MVIEKINKEGHNAAFNPVTIHCAKHGMENRRFELGPPGESKLPLSNRKYTDFLKILIIRISISFWIFIEDFAYYFTTNRTFLVGYAATHCSRSTPWISQPHQSLPRTFSFCVGMLPPCTSGQPNCYCKSGRSRAIMRVDAAGNTL